MSLLDAIKGPKTLSFNHWRYRLLHWCFFVKATCPAESPLPSFMYTHYCPLFHVTNLIALLSPAIALVRWTTWLIGLVLLGAFFLTLPIFWVCGKTWEMLTEFLPKQTKTKKQFEEEELRRRSDIKFLKELINKGRGDQYTPEQFYSRYMYEFQFFSKEELMTMFEIMAEEHRLKAELAAERAKLRAKREEEWRAFFSSMAIYSQIIVKCLLYVLYAGMLIGAAALIYYGTMPLLSFLYLCCQLVYALFGYVYIWFVETFTYETVMFILTIVGGVIAIATTILMIALVSAKIRLLTAIDNGLIATGRAFSPIFGFFGKIIAWPFVQFYNVCYGVATFIAMFYEENCPPITIVCDEQKEED